jgi:hypothetical protein
VLITSVGVIGTGVVLALAGSSAGPWLFLHKAFFVLWFGVMTIHVLTYVWRLPGLIGADLRGPAGFNRARGVLAGRATRWLLLTASIVWPADRGHDGAPGRPLGGAPPLRVSR